jgi:hypothetical protein
LGHTDLKPYPSVNQSDKLLKWRLLESRLNQSQIPLSTIALP